MSLTVLPMGSVNLEKKTWFDCDKQYVFELDQERKIFFVVNKSLTPQVFIQNGKQYKGMIWKPIKTYELPFEIRNIHSIESLEKMLEKGRLSISNDHCIRLSFGLKGGMQNDEDFHEAVAAIPGYAQLINALDENLGQIYRAYITPGQRIFYILGAAIGGAAFGAALGGVAGLATAAAAIALGISPLGWILGAALVGAAIFGGVAYMGAPDAIDAHNERIRGIQILVEGLERVRKSFFCYESK